MRAKEEAAAEVARVRALLDQARADVRNRLDLVLAGVRETQPMLDRDLCYAAVVLGIRGKADPDFVIAMLAEAVMRLADLPVQKGQN